MARISFARALSQSLDRCVKCLLLIAFVSAFAALSGLAQAQTSASIALTGSSFCADINSQSLAPGADAITWTCNGGTNQSWLPTASGSQYTFLNQNSNLCMDVSGASKAAGAAVIQWTCNGGTNQSFSLKAQGNGYAIVAQHSGMCLAAASQTNQGSQILQQVCNGSALQTWQVNGLPLPALPSKWTAPITLPIIPVAAANLPDGTVLVWSADSQLNFTPGEVTPGNTYTAIFNPTTGTSKQVLVTNTGHDMFCPGIVNLPDGRIYVTGGSSSDLTSFYTPSTHAWTSGDLMNIPRAYQGSVTLSNGSVFLVGGSWNGPLGGKTGETWTSGSGWQLNSAITDDYILTNDAGGIFRADNHAWLFAVANGRVFHAGPSMAMHWFDTAGAGSVTQAGNRGNDNDAMNGNAVMYDIGKILAVGGAPSYDSSPATSNATLINISSGTAVTTTLRPMNYQRAFNNSVVLPNGQVVVVGGQTFAQPFSDDTAVLTPELWDPVKQTFSPLAPQAVPRVYHSVALLLPDGRVLSGGGGLCGTCSTNHPNIEILTPPYLLNANGSAASRPTISSVPATAQLGTSIAVAASSGVKAFALMRLSSATHSVNNEQRRVPVSFTVGTAGEYLVAIPSDPSVVVPGYYMLFALNANGVPSVSKTLLIQ
ncbi:RICIN domain-containing protein [Paraburkholderia fungorum]|uniref:Galactose oxidase n=1 Tax=Paraburkholderia fungorum TaxID=134537 RepID=A0A3R7E4S7_9BURK|nr:RICIN domain-containing protein [Paraburkholderia fungorum]RKF43489.1 galactose oxidase [Paraburkholderia fungorum]